MDTTSRLSDRLLEIVQRAAGGLSIAGIDRPEPAFVTIRPPTYAGDRWKIGVSHGGRVQEGDTLAEAVDAMIAELDDRVDYNNKGV